MTPLGVPGCVMLKALYRFAKTFICVPGLKLDPSCDVAARFNSNAFEKLKLTLNELDPKNWTGT